MSPVEERFVRRAIGRQKLFLGLSVAGLIVAAGLAVGYALAWRRDPAFPIGPRAVIVLLVLLNSRQNLRQYRYARALAGLMSDRPAER